MPLPALLKQVIYFRQQIMLKNASKFYWTLCNSHIFQSKRWPRKKASLLKKLRCTMMTLVGVYILG